MATDRPTRRPSAATPVAALVLLSALALGGAGCDQGAASSPSAAQSRLSPALEARVKGARSAQERHALLRLGRMTDGQEPPLVKRKAGFRKEKKKH
jgi:hypothetical protein